MWKLRVLKGPRSSETIELKMGDNIIGRSPNCTICIASAGLSKEHAKITVLEDGVYVTDLKSTNGTFVNGVRVQRQKLRASDKVAFFDVIVGFEVSGSRDLMPTAMPSSMPMSIPSQGNLAVNTQSYGVSQSRANLSSVQPQAAQRNDFIGTVQSYVENVMLPGVYQLAEVIEFKWLIGFFIAAFAVIVTSLAVVPMINITREGIQVESQSRALSISRALAMSYERAVQDGSEGTFTSRNAERERGVQTYYIVSSIDGVVLAPPSRAGRRPDVPFVHMARKQDSESVSQIDSNLIGAAVPIKSIDRDSGNVKVVSHAIVLYDMSSISVNTDRIISLFVQVLSITLTIGFMIYFFLYKLIEFPIKSLNSQVDQALKDNSTMTQSKYLFPELQNLVSNINTALNRISNPQTQGRSFYVDRSQEAISLVQMYPEAAVSITVDGTILANNEKFSQLVGLAGVQISGQSYQSLNDQALVLNLKDMFEQSVQGGNISVEGQLEFNGKAMKVNLTPIFDEKGVKYYLIGIFEGGF